MVTNYYKLYKNIILILGNRDIKRIISRGLKE